MGRRRFRLLVSIGVHGDTEAPLRLPKARGHYGVLTWDCAPHHPRQPAAIHRFMTYGIIRRITQSFTINPLTVNVSGR